jgi:hypothetical protein
VRNGPEKGKIAELKAAIPSILMLVHEAAPAVFDIALFQPQE